MFTDISVVLAAFNVRVKIILVLEAASACETSMNFYQAIRHDVSDQKTVVFILAGVRT
jgi:hypothetical protein